MGDATGARYICTDVCLYLRGERSRDEARRNGEEQRWRERERLASSAPMKNPPFPDERRYLCVPSLARARDQPATTTILLRGIPPALGDFTPVDRHKLIRFLNPRTRTGRRVPVYFYEDLEEDGVLRKYEHWDGWRASDGFRIFHWITWASSVPRGMICY